MMMGGPLSLSLHVLPGTGVQRRFCRPFKSVVWKAMLFSGSGRTVFVTLAVVHQISVVFFRPNISVVFKTTLK